MSGRRKLMIMAAGTGGHIFPGLAIAQTMQAQGWDVTWLGTMHGMEGSIVPVSYTHLMYFHHVSHAICAISR